MNCNDDGSVSSPTFQLIYLHRNLEKYIVFDVMMATQLAFEETKEDIPLKLSTICCHLYARGLLLSTR